MATCDKYFVFKGSLMGESNVLDDCDWIGMLLSNDKDINEKAWDLVRAQVVERVYVKYNNIVRDLNLERGDLVNMIYEKFVAQGKLSRFGFRCPLRYWMQTCLMYELFRLHRKFQPTVDPGVLSGILVDERSTPWEEVTRKEELALMARDFATLWKKNPLQSYVLLLRTKTRMSSAQIQRLLNVSSVSHVDKMTERARKEIGELASVWLQK